MKKIFFIIILILATVFLFGCVTQNLPDGKVYVAEVIDGDTFKLQDGTRVRLLGIDTPEKGECYYEEARDELKKLIGSKVVRADKDISDKDKYDRLLRYVILEREGEDNLFVNDYLVRQGLAIDIGIAPDNRYRDLLSSAGEEAKRERRGIWENCDRDEALSLREEDSLPQDPSCNIKGNISEKGYGKTYLIPGCDNYNSVKIDTRKGEQFFCTEEEAVTAGFRKATNCP
jgi:micrococcal nuclease